MDAVVAYGDALLAADSEPIGAPVAVGLDEVLFFRQGRWRTQRWSTQIVDVRAGKLLDIVEGRDTTAPTAWFEARGEDWCARVRWACLDMLGPYRAVFDTLPQATQVADPLHLVKLANQALEEAVADRP